MAATTQHIPAWKRLGLKLKNAPEVPAVSETPKRKRETEYRDSAQAKRPKTNEAASIATVAAAPGPEGASQIKKKRKDKKANQLATTSSPASNTASVPDQQPLTTPLRLMRQKSVTFTPETKQEDGDSIKQLFNSWVAEQKEKDPNFILANSQQPAFTEPEPPVVEEQISNSLSDKENRVKRVKDKTDKKEKKPKRGKKTALKPSNLDPALVYLDQFCTSRDTWKFNKINQINLLKNVYDAKLIPSANIEQFYTYVKDLKGHARTLLRDSALKVKIKDQEDGLKGFTKKLDDPVEAQADYDAAVNEYVSAMTAADSHLAVGHEESVLAGLPNHAVRSRIVKRIRAERILADLNRDDSEISRTIDLPEIQQGDQRAKTNGKVVRKRKQRTAIDVSSDSSSSESSDSDSDSDDDKSGVKVKSSRSSSTPQAPQGASMAADTSSSDDSDTSTASDEIADTSSDAETDSDSD